MPENLEFPPGFHLRPVSVDDAPSVARVINACMLVEIGRRWTTEERIRTELTSPGIDLAKDHPVVVADDGELVGYLEIAAAGDPLDQVETIPFVDPAFWGRGLSSFLLEAGERRAREIVAAARVPGPVGLLVARIDGNEHAERLFVSRGFVPIRRFHLMRIEHLESPPPPTIPEGLQIRAFERDRDARAVYDAMMEAFADHWGSDPTSFEQWLHLEADGADFDPNLWFIAFDGDQVAGLALCAASTPSSPDTAEVNDLAVRRPWRRRGLGLALLLSAFRAFAERGIEAAELGVDSANPTGATRLYERAGMTPVYAWEWWRKDLHAG